MASRDSGRRYSVRRSPQFSEQWSRTVNALVEEGVFSESSVDELDRSLERVAGHYLSAGIPEISIAAESTEDGHRYLIEFRPPLRIWIQVIPESSIAYLDGVDVY